MAYQDPYQRIQARKDKLRANNLIRNKMQLLARDLERQCYSLISQGQNAHVESVNELIGQMKGYIKTRIQLAPDVAQDGFSNELSQCIKKLTAHLEVIGG